MRFQEKYTVAARLSPPDVLVQQKAPTSDKALENDVDLSSATLQELVYRFMDLAKEADW